MSNLSSAIRLLRAGFVFAREGVITSFDRSLFTGSTVVLWYVARFIAKNKTANQRRSKKLTNALEKLGPTYIKLGQFLATRPDVVGVRLADELKSLQDDVPPFADAEARKVVEANLNKSITAAFADFSSPVAAASIAQVHKANIRTDDGLQEVAVKILRPGIRHKFARDIETFTFAAANIERFIASSRRLRPLAAIQNLARTITLETDLRIEAAAMSEIAENSINDDEFATPQINWQLSARDILVSSWIDGIALSEPREKFIAAGIDVKQLAVVIIQTFLRHALRDGFFHADMHPGNLFVDHSGRLIAVDFGIMGRLGLKERLFLAEILRGFITRDYQLAARAHFAAGYVPLHHSVAQFAQALRAIGEPIHGRPANEISMAKLLALLFEVTELFDMQTRPELILLQKNMVIVEGVARKFDPELDMWKIADPVVREWINNNLGVQGQIKSTASAVRGLAMNLVLLPDLLDNIALFLPEVSNKLFRPEAREQTREQTREQRRCNHCCDNCYSKQKSIWPLLIALGLIAALFALWLF